MVRREAKMLIEVNIRIIRVFTKLKEYALTHTEILMQLAKLEKEVKRNSNNVESIVIVLKEVLGNRARPNAKNSIGCKTTIDQLS